MGRKLVTASPPLVALLVAVLAAAGPAWAATHHAPTLAPAPTVVDGPSSDIVGLSGMAIGRDGTGTVVYLKQIQGVTHVFASSLLGGHFGSPVQVDTGLAGASSQAVVAATNGGLTVIAFVNGGELYTVQRPSAFSPWQAPVPLFAGASNPSISMSPFGKAYLAFTAAHSVRVAYDHLGQWALASTSLNVNPTADAGTGTDRPEVVTAGDGTGIVAWGENGHIYVRRVLGTVPSTAWLQADPASLSGWSEVSADEPAISSGGDSSYASVAFRETLTDGVSQQTRVLDNRLHASEMNGAKPVDGLTTPGPESADDPASASLEYGGGLVTAQRTQTNNILVSTMGDNASLQGTFPLNTMPQQSPADAVPSSAGIISTFTAWQQDPGTVGIPEIRVRYAPNGNDLGSEVVVSTPTLGPTDAARGLAAGGDLAGNAAVAWVQGTGVQTRIVAGQLFQPPGPFSPSVLFRYANSTNPWLIWSPAAEDWGPIHYVVKFDGVQITDTTSTRIRTPKPVRQGRHSWQVTAVNLGGVVTSARTSTVFVDSLPPRVTVKITGPRHPQSTLHLYVGYSDTRRGVPRGAASGVTSARVKWGDGAKTSMKHNKFHAYGHRGTFKLVVTVRDKAGNRTIVTKKLKIVPTPPPTRRHKVHHR